MMEPNELHSDLAREVATLLDGGETGRIRNLAIKRFDEWWHENRDGSPKDADGPDLIAFMKAIDDRDVAPQTLRSYRDSLSVFYLTAIDNFPKYGIQENPVQSVRGDWSRYIDGYGTETMKERYAGNDEGIIYLSRQETRKLRENVQSPRVRNELLIKLMVQTGARRNEVSTIKLDDDLDQDKKSITLNDDKTGKSRTVPYADLSPELDAWIDKYRDGYKPASSSEYLFVTQHSEQIHPSTVNKIVKRAAENAGIQETMYSDANGNDRNRVTAHCLRHTFAIRMLEQEVPIRHLQELMGHEDISETQIYLEIGAEEAAKAYHDADPTFEADS